jgi:hypothetical protein
MKEYILCSAIWYKDLPTMRNLPINCDKGLVLCGHRHGNIIAQLHCISGLRTVKLGPDSVGENHQGFLTNLNRFVDRKEAGLIAYAAMQTAELHVTLFSEDLY